jgi:hypothetical protein
MYKDIMDNVNIVTRNNKKTRHRVSANDFRIPHYDEYHLFQTLNYTIKQLKSICIHYGLHRSGNKKGIETRVVNYLLKSSKVCIIQRAWRKKLWSIVYKLIGPAAYNRSLCVNTTDFFTRQPLIDIEWNQFISLKDIEENKIYGFDIMSLYQLFKKTQKAALNPYTRISIHKYKPRLKRLIRILRILGQPACINIEQENFTDMKQQQELVATSLFQEINRLGNYTDPMWFMRLSRHSLIKFIRELRDIWYYRAQLSPHVQREICPPAGAPFRDGMVYILSTQSMEEIRDTALYNIRMMVTIGSNDDFKTLGAYYVLCALTLVSDEARNALPWLYHAVSDLT